MCLCVCVCLWVGVHMSFKFTKLDLGVTILNTMHGFFIKQMHTYTHSNYSVFYLYLEQATEGRVFRATGQIWNS